jgi:hypothetical protein
VNRQDNGTDGPYILWLDYGVDGWSPKSFPTLKDALIADRRDHDWVITKRLDFIAYESEWKPPAKEDDA